MAGDLKYWLDGLPFEKNENQDGLKYWMDGLPFEIPPDDTPVVTATTKRRIFIVD